MRERAGSQATQAAMLTIIQVGAAGALEVCRQAREAVPEAGLPSIGVDQQVLTTGCVAAG